MGIEVHEVKQGFAKLSLRVTNDHLNFVGYTHGGVIFALADCAFAEACNFGYDKAVALQVSINYLKPSSEGDTLIAEATKVSEGKTFALYNVTISKDDRLVAVFSGLAYKLPSNQGS